MSSLDWREKAKLEGLFEMDGGYVLQFSNGSFQNFVAAVVGLNIWDDKYKGQHSGSKANTLRAFWDVEPDPVVGALTKAMIEKSVEFAATEAKDELVQECRSIADRLLAGGTRTADLKRHADIFDAKQLHDQIKRMEASAESDPSLAIGTAKELIETCCQTILQERGVALPKSPDVPTLTKMALKELGLVPDDVDDAKRGADTIKRLLSNLGTIGNNLAELRNLYGTGHGRGARARGLEPRHARLAVGAAATLSVFLLETHQETRKP